MLLAYFPVKYRHSIKTVEYQAHADCFSAIFPRSSHPHGTRREEGRVNKIRVQKLRALQTDPRSVS